MFQKSRLSEKIGKVHFISRLEHIPLYTWVIFSEWGLVETVYFELHKVPASLSYQLMKPYLATLVNTGFE